MVLALYETSAPTGKLAHTPQAPRDPSDPAALRRHFRQLKQAGVDAVVTMSCPSRSRTGTGWGAASGRGP